MSDVTQILQSAAAGEAGAAERLLSIVYDELHRIASSKLSRETPGQTLQATALVHEAYLKLMPVGDRAAAVASKGNGPRWDSRGHFFAAAAEAMRRILVDNARRKNRLKRGGDFSRVPLDNIHLNDDSSSIDLIALDEALTKFEQHSPDKATVVKLRYFAGLTLEETADALSISVPTVHRHWRYARAWLRRELEDASD